MDGFTAKEEIIADRGETIAVHPTEVPGQLQILTHYALESPSAMQKAQLKSEVKNVEALTLDGFALQEGRARRLVCVFERNLQCRNPIRKARASELLQVLECFAQSRHDSLGIRRDIVSLLAFIAAAAYAQLPCSASF